MSGSLLVRRPAVALLLAAACWGAGVVLSKQAVAEIPPLALLPIQLAVSVAFLLVVARAAAASTCPTDRGGRRLADAWCAQPRPGVRPEPPRAGTDHGQPLGPAVGTRACPDPAARVAGAPRAGGCLARRAVDGRRRWARARPVRADGIGRLGRCGAHGRGGRLLRGVHGGRATLAAGHGLDAGGRGGAADVGAGVLARGPRRRSCRGHGGRAERDQPRWPGQHGRVGAPRRRPRVLVLPHGPASGSRVDRRRVLLPDPRVRVAAASLAGERLEALQWVGAAVVAVAVAAITVRSAAGDADRQLADARTG